MNSSPIKVCEVPLCQNTSKVTPNKLFIPVPTDKYLREQWSKLSRRNLTDSCSCSKYFCEDHFDLPSDMENYMQYLLRGSVDEVKMENGCLPSKFHCQEDVLTKTTTYGSRKPLDNCTNNSVKHQIKPKEMTKNKYVQVHMDKKVNKSKSNQTEDKYFEVTPVSSDLENTLSTENCANNDRLSADFQNRMNEMLVRVYEYVASECGELSRAQLRQRTALCAGVTQAAVQRALELTQHGDLPPSQQRRNRRKRTLPPDIVVADETVTPDPLPAHNPHLICSQPTNVLPDTNSNGSLLVLEIRPMDLRKYKNSVNIEMAKSSIDVKTESNLDEIANEKIKMPKSSVDVKTESDLDGIVKTEQSETDVEINGSIFENASIKLDIQEDFI